MKTRFTQRWFINPVAVRGTVLGIAAWVLPSCAGMPEDAAEEQLLLNTQAVAATVSITDDATVREDAPGTNFGAETEISSDNGTGVVAEMFIKFSVSNIPAGATVNSAQLKLTCFNGTDNGPGVRLASNTSPTAWTEGTVTWNTRPASVSPADLDNVGTVTASTTSPALVTWNLTSGVTGNGVYTLRLAQNSSDGLGCASRQHPTAAYRPVVTVDYTTGTDDSGELRWFWYGASAQGTGDGSSHANRKAYTALSADMNGSGVRPGDAFLLAASDTYPAITSAINITPNAGTSANRVVLRGANPDRSAAHVTLKSNRSDPYVSPRDGGAPGTTVLNLGSAAKPVNSFTISHINFEAVGRGMQVLGGAQNLLVTDIRFRNIRILLRAENNAYLRNSTIQRVVGYGFSKELIDLGRKSSGSNHSEFVTIDNVFADSQWQDGDEIPAGVAIHGDKWVDDAKTIAGAGNRNITIKNSTFKNVKFSPLASDSDQYYQGDGISTEERDYNITIDNVTVDGAGDAGMDMKACASIIKNSAVSNAKRSVRKHPGTCPTGISDTLTVENIKSRNPLQPGGSGREAHIWATHGAKVVYNANANGAGEFYTTRAPTSSTAACFLTENDGIAGTTITVNAGAVTKPTAFNLTYGDGTETIGSAVTVTNL